MTTGRINQVANLKQTAAQQKQKASAKQNTGCLVAIVGKNVEAL